LSIVSSKVVVGYAPLITLYSQVSLLIKTLPGVHVIPNVSAPNFCWLLILSVKILFSAHLVIVSLLAPNLTASSIKKSLSEFFSLYAICFNS